MSMNSLAELATSCKIIEAELEKIKQIALNSEFEEVCRFKVDDDDTAMFDAVADKMKGIYLLEIRRDDQQDYVDWINSFTKKFRGLDGAEKCFLHQFTPNIIEKRKYLHKEENNEWIPFYMGKSKNIKERIKTHVFSELGRPPFALKLKGRRDKEDKFVFHDEEFRLKVLYLSDVEDKVYDAVVTHFEKELRKKFSPIVGKQ
jgi:hypothetical protein